MFTDNCEVEKDSVSVNVTRVIQLFIVLNIEKMPFDMIDMWFPPDRYIIDYLFLSKKKNTHINDGNTLQTRVLCSSFEWTEMSDSF